jgi:hypothetical protein
MPRSHKWMLSFLTDLHGFTIWHRRQKARASPYRLSLASIYDGIERRKGMLGVMSPTEFSSHNEPVDVLKDLGRHVHLNY